MTRRTVPQASASAVPGRADRWISRAAVTTVAGLAGIAAAISYSHMRALAVAHGQAGWHAHAFPLSVDGVELVASLVLLADRRADRRSGWLPWAALTLGTAASLAANVATADTGMVSRVIAGWPALALLIAVKLLSGILSHQAAAADRPRDKTGPPARPVPARGRTGTTGPSRRPAPTEATASPPVPAEVTPILSAARTARDQLHQQGQSLTRDALAHHLRQAGHQVRNSRLTALLQTLGNDAA